LVRRPRGSQPDDLTQITPRSNWRFPAPLPILPDMETVVVQCPTCFETFEVVMPSLDELPTEVDYDCEICCRPMIIVFDEGGAFARGLGD